MAFFDDLSNKVTKLGKDVSQKTKSFTGSVQLNSQINEQKKNQSRLFEELGRMAYQNEEIRTRSEFAELAGMIQNAENTIKELEVQLSVTKGEVQCKNCGSFVPSDNAFCPKCGTKVEVPVAPQQPVQDGAPQADASNGAVCVKCGAPLSADSAFCTNCGTPVNQ